VKKIILIVLDGWGIAPDGPGNCISQAHIPFYNSLLEKYPHCQLHAHGNAVGLREDAMGTSEVGHLHMGAGRIVWQPIAQIDRDIKNGEFFKNKKLVSAMETVRKRKTRLHFMGICSDGGVHSSIEHLDALLKLAKQQKVPKVYIHFFSDGRDVPEKSALTYVKQVEKQIQKNGIGKIASVIGRYYAGDRDNNWDRTQKAFDCLVNGKGFTAKNASDAVQQAYARGDLTDYYIQPTIISEKNKPLATISDGDVAIFFNIRTDRIRQLIKSIVLPNFKGFKRPKTPKVDFYSFVQTETAIPANKCVPIFNPIRIKNNLGNQIARQGYKQLRVAETDKYAHVTYFFNSQVDEPNPGEDRIMVPTPKVPVYDQKPEMSAREITEKVTEQIKTGKYDFILMNYANADLVGHSANIPAIIIGVQTIDQCLQHVIENALAKNYSIMVTADHGNAEEKLSPTGERIASHSCNPVPFILVSNEPELQKTFLRSNGQLIDIAPTILELMNLSIPKEMTGKSLILKNQKK